MAKIFLMKKLHFLPADFFPFFQQISIAGIQFKKASISVKNTLY